jgi:hypothetical protein
MDISAIALQGLNQADAQLQQAATAIASAGTDSSGVGNVDTVDIASEIIALSAAKNLFAANLSALKVAGEIQKNTIDIQA